MYLNGCPLTGLFVRILVHASFELDAHCGFDMRSAGAGAART